MIPKPCSKQFKENIRYLFLEFIENGFNFVHKKLQKPYAYTKT
jgi:hypothetical protein